MKIYHSTLITADGPFTMIAHQESVLAAGWTPNTKLLLARLPHIETTHLSQNLGEISTAVIAYYGQEPEAIMNIPVIQQGGEFITRAWASLRKIPLGKPVSYAKLAELTGNKKAIRAAARACAQNHVSLFVPCHRVIRTDGSLGNFRWGPGIKEQLLHREFQAIR